MSIYTWLALLVGATIGVLAAALFAIGKRQDEQNELDEPTTILILPPDEPLEQVNLSEYVRGQREQPPV